MKAFSQAQIALVAGRSRALGDPTRIRILTVLERGEQPVGHIAESLKSQQSTVSKHLQVLFHAGLVQRRREASAVIYRVSAPDVVEWCRYLGAHHLARRESKHSTARMDSSRAHSTRRSPQRTR